MKCNFCEEQLEYISIIGDHNLYLSHKELCRLYACTSRDCKNCGNVIVIPDEPKED